MLTIVTIQDPSERWDFFSKVNKQETSLLVPDIKTKLSIERRFLQEQKFLSGFCVLRIQDFFETLFYNYQSYWQVVSDSFLSHKFLEFVWSYNKKFKSLHQHNMLIDQLNQFLPILLYPQHSYLLEEWFQNKEQSYFSKWKHWYMICQDFFNFMKSEKMIHQSGIKFVIMNDILKFKNQPWDKKNIIVDLGMSLDFCEAFIIKELSFSKDITLLAPSFASYNFYKGEDTIYADLLKDVAKNQIKKQKSKNISTVKFLKIKNETALQEVKQATAQVRQWLDTGVNHKDIAILAPYIESYWPALKNHLEKENILFNKSSTDKLSHFSSIRHWLSSLHIYIGSSSFFQWEEYFFNTENFFHSFQKFYNSYFKTSESSYIQAPIPPYKKDKKRNPEQEVYGEEFLEWAISFLPTEWDEKILDSIYKIFSSFLLHKKLKWKTWLSFLESEIFHGSVEIKKEKGEGIFCVSLNAVLSLKASHVFILGLDEDAMQTPSKTMLNQKDREALSQDLGFNLPYFHPKEKEYELLWFLQSSSLKEVYLSCSTTNFSGGSLAPSLFYTLSNYLFKNIEEVSYCQISSWDSIKQQKDRKLILQKTNHSEDLIMSIDNYFEDYKKNSGFSNELSIKQNDFHDEKSKLSVEKDKSIAFKKIWNKRSISLSTSQLELYFKCPFQYAARYLFFTEDLFLRDRELSPKDSGIIFHKLFQTILEQTSLDQALKDLDHLIKDLKLDDLGWLHRTQKSIVEKNLIIVAKEFIQLEKKRQTNFPYLKPYKFEKKIQGFWNKKLARLAKAGDYLFTGKVDRIDQSNKGQQYWLIDYKRSSVQHTHIGKWNQNGFFQLLLYAQAAEEGLIEDLGALPISALLYYFYKDFSHKGYIDKSHKPEEDFIFKSPIYKEDLKLSEAIQQACDITQDIVEKIEQGQFDPKPKDKKECDKCSYKTWCRARHLHG